MKRSAPGWIESGTPAARAALDVVLADEKGTSILPGWLDVVAGPPGREEPLVVEVDHDAPARESRAVVEEALALIARAGLGFVVHLTTGGIALGDRRRFLTRLPVCEPPAWLVVAGPQSPLAAAQELVDAASASWITHCRWFESRAGHHSLVSGEWHLVEALFRLVMRHQLDRSTGRGSPLASGHGRLVAQLRRGFELAARIQAAPVPEARRPLLACLAWLPYSVRSMRAPRHSSPAEGSRP